MRWNACGQDDELSQAEGPFDGPAQIGVAPVNGVEGPAQDADPWRGDHQGARTSIAGRDVDTVPVLIVQGCATRLRPV
jgi:hypothetical protein